MVRLADFVVRLALTAAVTALMLVPAGVCLCGHEEGGAAETHQAGCPEARKLDRPDPAVLLMVDATPLGTVPATEALAPGGPPRVVAAVAHGPPLYVTLQTLLI